MKEIGSEFWLDNNFKLPGGYTAELKPNSVYVLSGRTAIDFIVRDIKKVMPTFSSVSLPSYCCESMVSPFFKNDITVSFYKVKMEESSGSLYPDIDLELKDDAYLFLDYFGYVNKETIKAAEYVKNKGKLVIYDSTHMLYESKEMASIADYTFCSYRKWFYSNAASITKKSEYNIQLPASTNTAYVGLRNHAAAIKKEYLNGMSADKADFLEAFSQAEELLETGYTNYSAEPVSVDCLLNTDINSIVNARRENAKYLSCELTKLGVKHMKYNDDSCPLFVPIFLETEVRNNLKSELINNNIYCPTHWPMFSLNNKSMSEFSSSELSLICDQRYGIEEMEKEVYYVAKSLKN